MFVSSEGGREKFTTTHSNQILKYVFKFCAVCLVLLPRYLHVQNHSKRNIGEGQSARLFVFSLYTSFKSLTTVFTVESLFFSGRYRHYVVSCFYRLLAMPHASRGPAKHLSAVIHLLNEL